MTFSFIIPVFNRPDEIDELLASLVKQTATNFDVIVIEDGSTISCDKVVEKYVKQLAITYYLKYNSGPGDSRNFGMMQSKSNYFIILDSDCILPPNYFLAITKSLEADYVDCFGGFDTLLPSFSPIQKAINFSMTSVLTTGGIRGKSEKMQKFQPRSYNMGLSKKAFLATSGFSNIHPGEDPELVMRLWKLGFDTKLITEAFVYHKRRIDWEKFYIQVTKFGKVRPILNLRFPEYAKFTFWLPSIFVVGIPIGIIASLFNIDWILQIYFLFTVLIFLVSSVQNKNIYVGYLSIKAVWKQFFGYGIGFLKSYFKINILKIKPEVAFPELFFKIK